MNIFAEICKVNDEERMVYGYASTEAMDVQGERVSKDALAKALPDYMRFANIREMHQPSAVGVAKSAEIDEKGLYLAAKVVDDDAWHKVKEGVYKGFSIGGKSVSKVDETITELRLSEISLVDRPANPEAVIEVWKADGIEQQPAIDALAELLNKGEITPERLLELAKSATAEPAPASEPAAVIAELPAEVAETVAAEVAKSYEGEEVYDAATALSALDSIMYLLSKERSEDEQMPEQISALEAAVAALKDFIQSEIAEDNAEAKEGEIEMADQGGDIEKVGKTISAKNMKKIQDVHDHTVAMGAACAKADDAEKSDDADDLAKADALSKLVEEAIAKAVTPLKDELNKAHAEIERMKNMPLPGKALLKAVAKADDVSDAADTPSTPIVKDAAGKPNEVASLIKMIHQHGGVR